MDILSRTERAIELTVQRAEADSAPPRICAAIRHALFPGGARVRPQLCMAVAKACDNDAPGLAEAAGAAVELMHCASLVHDDMPVFDDADFRRGKPTVHVAFDEPLALLVGDAMIVMAFEALAFAGSQHPRRLAPLVTALARATGMPAGIVAGQAWESEAEISLAPYHRAKTGALFVAATRMGALSAGSDPMPWRTLGDRLGEAYQVADDLRDAVSTPEELGKPVGQDEIHERPNAVREHGVQGALGLLERLLDEASSSIPSCPGEGDLKALVRMQGKRLTPRSLAPASVA